MHSSNREVTKPLVHQTNFTSIQIFYYFHTQYNKCEYMYSTVQGMSPAEEPVLRML